MHPDDRADHVGYHCAIATKGGFDLESRVVVPDGGIRWMRSAGRVIAIHQAATSGSSA